ncbi:MAG: glycoside hydrolase family 2 protein [Halobacteriales archaeon]
MASVPRPEHPRPQQRREEWRTLNGEWEFEVDPGRSGRARGLPDADELAERITVPFAPESDRSGIGRTDFMPAVWYRREVEIPGAWLDGRVHLRFEAVDYEAEVWVNGESVGTHRGGYAPFALDVTDALEPGNNEVVVSAEDDVRTGRQPAGKQSDRYDSYGVLYTRVTGIWGPVWLEAVPETYVGSLRLDPDLEAGRIHVRAEVAGPREGELSVRARLDGEDVGRDAVPVAGPTADLAVDLDVIEPWTLEDPTLYDLSVRLETDGGTDEVETYAGLRSLAMEDGVLHLNGEPTFQRLVLDQGYYPDGLYTAPSDDALRADIELAQELGFNGARLHEKVFEARFLYHADRLGYLVWGEYGDWGLDRTDAGNLGQVLEEWLEVVERDCNHPSIVGWCPFNETPADRDPDLQRPVYRATKRLDPTRPVIDASGYHHVETDVVDIHDYDDDPESFRERYERVREGESVCLDADHVQEEYDPRLSFVSEYGGAWWNPEAPEDTWGHGSRPGSPEEFLERYRGLTEALLENPTIGAFCYTQLYDIEQEVNGLYTYDREPKFDDETMAEIRGINETTAAVERE